MENKEQQFNALVQQHKSTIYTVCYMFSDNQDDVADLFQEALINLWKGFDGFRGDSQVDTWIYRVTMNTCISQERKKKHRGEKAELSLDLNLFANSQEKDTQQIQQMHQRIHQLSVVDRAIVMLWLENLSYDEIGAIVGISAKNVSVKLVRIKEQLKNNH